MTTTSIAVLPSVVAQWRLMNLLAIRQLFTAQRHAPRMLDRAGAEPADLGDLAEIGWIRGHDRTGADVDLVNDWNHGLSQVYLGLTSLGLTWVAHNPHNQLLFQVADAQGALALRTVQLRAYDEVLIALSGRRLITMQNANGRDVVNATEPPSRQFHGGTLHVRLTAAGERIINP